MNDSLRNRLADEADDYLAEEFGFLSPRQRKKVISRLAELERRVAALERHDHEFSFEAGHLVGRVRVPEDRHGPDAPSMKED